MRETCPRRWGATQQGQGSSWGEGPRSESLRQQGPHSENKARTARPPLLVLRKPRNPLLIQPGPTLGEATHYSQSGKRGGEPIVTARLHACDSLLAWKDAESATARRTSWLPEALRVDSPLHKTAVGQPPRGHSHGWRGCRAHSQPAAPRGRRGPVWEAGLCRLGLAGLRSGGRAPPGPVASQSSSVPARCPAGSHTHRWRCGCPSR